MARIEKLTLWQAAGHYLDAVDAERELKREGLARSTRYKVVKSWRDRAEKALRKAVKENG